MASDNSGHLGRVADYMDPADPRWASIQTPPYMGVTHPYSTAQHGSAVLTPISLADSTYLQARPSPVMSHHSQEYSYIDDNAVSQGLGISSPYQELIPAPTSSPSFSYQHHHQQHQQQLPPPHHVTMDMYGYGAGHAQDAFPLERMSAKRPRRQTTTGSTGTSSLRNSPVRILPHPDGLQRLEHERRLGGHIMEPSQPEIPKPRPSGRGRRDPQAEEEDAFVESLRAQNLSWKIVAEMFRERFGKNTSEARLQMRMLRRRKSAAAWQEADIPLLHEAYNYWRTEKIQIIAAKLQELGASQKYSDEQIQAQLKIADENVSDDEYTAASPKLEALKQTQTQCIPTLARGTKRRKRWLDEA